MQDHAELVAAHRARPAAVVLEQEDALVSVRVIGPVTDVVQGMERFGPQCPEQHGERRPHEPLQIDRMRLERPTQGVREAP